jgi:hypothetical protein
MDNRFNYRCPNSGRKDHINFAAIVSERLTGDSTEGDVPKSVDYQSARFSLQEASEDPEAARSTASHL